MIAQAAVQVVYYIIKYFLRWHDIGFNIRFSLFYIPSYVDFTYVAVVGVLGIKFYKTTEKSMLCFSLGLCSIIFFVIYKMLFLSIWGMIFNLPYIIIPALYTLIAFTIHKSPADADSVSVSKLFITSIALIVGAGIAILFSLKTNSSNSDVDMGFVILVMDFIACLQVVAGVVGVINCINKDKANLCYWLGILLTIISAVLLLLSFPMGYFSIFNITLVVLPLLYIYGAAELK